MLRVRLSCCCIRSFQGIPVVLLCHRKRWENQAGMHKQGWVQLSCCCNVTFLFRVLQLYCCTTGNVTFLFMALKLYCCTTENVTFLFMALKLYCCATGNNWKTKQDWFYEHKNKILRDSSILSFSLGISLASQLRRTRSARG